MQAANTGGATDADVGSDPPEEKPSGARTVAVATGIGLLGIILLNVAAIVVVLGGETAGVELVEDGGGIAPLPGLAVNGVGQVLAFGGLALGYLRYRGYGLAGARAYLGVRLPSLRELGAIVGGFVGMIVLLAVVSVIVSQFSSPADNVAAQNAAENPNAIPAMIVIMLLIVGPFEELLYRGIVQTRLRERFAPAAGIVTASVVFASVHAAGALTGTATEILTTVAVLFVVSLVLGGLYEYTGNLVVPAVVHGLFNSFQLAGIYFTETSGTISALVL